MITYNSKLQFCQRPCGICACWTDNVVTEDKKVLHVLCPKHANKTTVDKITAEKDVKTLNEIALIRLVATVAHRYCKDDLFGGTEWADKAVDDTLEKFKLTLTPEQVSISKQHAQDLDALERTTPRNPYTKGSQFYIDAMEARPRVQQFLQGDFNVYKKKRYKTKPVKKGHRKHHPDSKDIKRDIPWHVFNKEVRSKLTKEENAHTSDDELYCCWEENWQVNVTIDECKEAYDCGRDLRS